MTEINIYQPMDWGQLEVHSDILDCLNEIWDAYKNGDFEDTQIPGIVNVLSSKIDELFNDVNEVSLLILGDEITSEDGFYKKHKKSINTLIDIENHLKDSSEKKGFFKLSKIGNSLSEILNLIKKIKTEAYLNEIEICDEESGGDDDIKETYPFYLCRDYHYEFDCLCYLYDKRYDLMSEDAQEKLDDFYDDHASPFKDSLRGYTNDLPEDIEENDDADEKCPVFNEMQKRLMALCNYQDEFNVTEQEQIKNELKDFLDAYETLKYDLILLGYDSLCHDPAEPILQSDSIYVQAVGSDGSKGIPSGILLRWTFSLNLFLRHLPKGNLPQNNSNYYASHGFNKEDDFVYLYRIPFENPPKLSINFYNDPKSVFHSSKRISWVYRRMIQNKYIAVSLNFMDVESYFDAVQNAGNDAQKILELYDGIIYVQWSDFLMFGLDLQFNKNDGADDADIEYEILTSRKNNFAYDPSIACRNKLNISQEDNFIQKQHYCENISSIKFRSVKGNMPIIELYSYYDFIYKNWDQWEYIDKFALTDDDEVAFKRLEDENKFTIDNQWPRFNDGTKVDVEAYKHKWQEHDGVKDGVVSYLEKSTQINNSTAIDSLSSEEKDDLSEFKISYLKLLNMVANDYHIARMLGLGHIDTLPEGTKDDDKFVYMALYEKKGDQIIRGNYFMTLPTSRNDQRKPLTPKKPDIGFGIPGINKNGDLFDEEGYFLYHKIRAINIKREKYDFEEANNEFFNNEKTFCLCDRTIPIMYGIEYKDTNQSEFVKPEITNPMSGDGNGILQNDYYSKDSDFPEEGVRETIPVIDNLKSLFIHKETQNGIHDYALYGINWFSIASEISPIKTIDTNFPVHRKPMPPFNFNVQYIQKERSLLFTSNNEQDELNTRIDNGYVDPYFTRVTFMWTHQHNDHYPETNKIKIYYRESLLKEIKGRISNTNFIPESNKMVIYTESYESLNTGNIVIPNISSSEKSLFEGSLLKVEGQHFKVVEIQKTGDYPEIVIEGIPREKVSFNRTLASSPFFPNTDKMFTLMENFQNENQWHELEKEVKIKHFETDGFDPFYKEVSEDENGNKSVLNAGGIYAKATIENKFNEYYQGVYKITFNDTKLEDHPDANVEWFSGVIRAPLSDNGADKRNIDVLKIEQTDPITLWVYDSSDINNPEVPNIETGSDIYVNFHPGYRVYIYNENEPLLEHSELYPENGQKSNKRLVCARSVDDKDGYIFSPFSSPDVLFIREIIKPEKPEKPTGPTFATRPDYYGKASFTFDTEVNVNGRKPFGFIFYRATDKGILNKLYNKDTLEEEVWPLLKNDEFINDRLNSLVNAELENNEPIEFDGEKLPLPDVADPNDTESENIKAIDEAVAKAFAPLTERPPLYDFIEEGYQTKNETPQVKDPATGRFIEPSSPEFNPFPFIRKFNNDQGKRIIRFTDYTLDGASQDLVFYRVKEMNDEMEMSDPGDTIGPITLINSMPPEKPQIKKVESVAENPALNRAAGIRFNVEPYLKRDNVEHVRVYRTQNADKLPHVRLMEYAGDYPVNNIKDDFSDRDFPPFGEPVFYRLVALRKIQSDYTDNQDNPLEEFVPSQPSGPVVANVIDAVNPPAPEIVLKGFDWGNSVVNDVELQWNKTTHNGKYHLYKMSNAGNWQKIHTLATNDAPIVVDLANTELGTNQLTVEDQQGRPVYHHFKVVAENASGLLSKEENIWTIGGNNAEQAFFENYKTYVENNDGNIYNESQTINTFNETGADEEAAIFAAFSGIKLEPGNKLHQWFNHNLQGTHMETSDPDNRAEWTDIFRGKARVAIEKPTENKILTPDQCGNESSDWILAGTSAEPASSFFSDFDAWKIINNGSTSHRTAQAFNISAHGKVTFSAVVEKGTAEACRLRIWDGSVQGRFSFDLENGQQLNTSGEHVEFRKLANNGPNGGEVWLLAVTAEVNSTSITTDLWPDENGDEGHTFVHFTQLEESKYFTLPVEEVRSAAAPVLPDFLPSEDGSGEGTLYFWVDFVNDPDQPLHLLEADGNNNLSLKLNNNGAVELKWYDGNPHSNVLGGILPSDYKRAIRFIAITWDSASQLHLYWGDSEGNFQKTDTLTFNSTSINTQNIRPGQSENGNDQTSVMFHFLKADNQFRDDNAIEQLYNDLRQIIF